jgi:hypothetical protein
MPSPFPGMDPYLEDPAFWRDFHGRLIYAISEQLLDRLPADYDAAVDEQVRLVEVHPGEEEASRVDQDVLPDVAVSHVPSGSRAASAGGGAITLVPVKIPVPIEREVRDRWVEIRHKPDDELVTVIEVLSPTNKTGDGYGDYRAKRAAVLRQRVNLVELDLLLGGRRVERSEDLPVDDYYAVVARAHRRVEREVYAWNVRRPLPTIAVPLKPPDADVPLDIAASFATAYERGRYARRLRYSAPPSAPLNEADRDWARGLIASASR